MFIWLISINSEVFSTSNDQQTSLVSPIVTCSLCQILPSGAILLSGWETSSIDLRIIGADLLRVSSLDSTNRSRVLQLVQTYLAQSIHLSPGVEQRLRRDATNEKVLSRLVSVESSGFVLEICWRNSFDFSLRSTHIPSSHRNTSRRNSSRIFSTTSNRAKVIPFPNWPWSRGQWMFCNRSLPSNAWWSWWWIRCSLSTRTQWFVIFDNVYLQQMADLLIAVCEDQSDIRKIDRLL